jgi:hypothetical protein
VQQPTEGSRQSSATARQKGLRNFASTTLGLHAFLARRWMSPDQSAVKRTFRFGCSHGFKHVFFLLRVVRPNKQVCRASRLLRRVMLCLKKTRLPPKTIVSIQNGVLAFNSSYCSFPFCFRASIKTMSKITCKSWACWIRPMGGTTEPGRQQTTHISTFD